MRLSTSGGKLTVQCHENLQVLWRALKKNRKTPAFDKRT